MNGGDELEARCLAITFSATAGFSVEIVLSSLIHLVFRGLTLLCQLLGYECSLKDLQLCGEMAAAVR